MLIQIVSDLHLEFYADKTKFNFLVPSAPILALLGDTCCCASAEDFEIFKRFIAEILPLYEYIILIPGNHEYYFNPPVRYPPTKANTLQATDARIRDFCKSNPKLHYLNNRVLKITMGKKTYSIIGTALWSYIPPEEHARMETTMSDYKYIWVADGNKIRKLKAADVTSMFMKNTRMIKAALDKARMSNHIPIVLTHHRPYIDATYNVKSFDPAYHSDCSAWLKKPIGLVAFGHTHQRTDQLVNGVRVYSLPKGYPGQKTRFDRTSTVQV